MGRGPSGGDSAAADAVIDLLRGGDRAPAPLDPAWDACAGRIVAEGLSGVALGLIDRAGRLAHLTPRARRLLEGDLNTVRAEQLILFDRFERLVGVMDAAGIEFIVHKGAVLAPLVYDRLEDRPMVDVDILIHPEDWARTRDALRGAGYRLPAGTLEEFWLENYFNLSVMSPADPPSHFDLHWGLTQEGRYSVDTAALFDRAVPYRLGSMTLRRLDNEDLLLSLFLHLAYHYFLARLVWLYDMKRVIERWPIDWERLLSRASASGLNTVVALNLAFLDKLFPGLLPPRAAAAARLGPARRIVLRPLMSPEPDHLFRSEERRVNHFVIGLVAIDRPGDAIRFAGDRIARGLRWLGRRPKRR